MRRLGPNLYQVAIGKLIKSNYTKIYHLFIVMNAYFVCGTARLASYPTACAWAQLLRLVSMPMKFLNWFFSLLMTRWLIGCFPCTSAFSPAVAIPMDAPLQWPFTSLTMEEPIISKWIATIIRDTKWPATQSREFIIINCHFILFNNKKRFSLTGTWTIWITGRRAMSTGGQKKSINKEILLVNMQTSPKVASR